jgi:deoxyribose-phosphate aldolase
MKLTIRQICRMIDLSAVQAEHTEADVRSLAEHAKKYQVVAVFTLPSFTPLIADLVADEPEIAVGGVVAFPSGGETTAAKADQAGELVRFGCRELDMVMNIGRMRSGHHDYVRDDVRAVIEAGNGVPVKVILECHHLSEEQIKRACELCVEAGAAFVKTGTGWAPTGATLERVALMKSVVGKSAKVKAAGGVRDLHTLIEMYKRGAERYGIGLTSAIKILKECQSLPEEAIEV